MKRIIEIRPAEGGDDAKLFAIDLVAAYVRLCGRFGWRCHAMGELKLEIEGKDLTGLDNERGGHRIQRVPPTERNGRVHTSTVTVAVLDPLNVKARARPDSEFTVQWYSGTGKGGQYRNKHQNCVRLTHVATGLVQTWQDRERVSNLRNAKDALNKRLDKLEYERLFSGQNTNRKNQVGSGMRGDKRRTYRFREDSVYDSVRGKEARASQVMKGQFELLW